MLRRSSCNGPPSYFLSRCCKRFRGKGRWAGGLGCSILPAGHRLVAVNPTGNHLRRWASRPATAPSVGCSPCDWVRGRLHAIDMACIVHGSNSPFLSVTGGAWHRRQRGLPRDYLRTTRLCNAGRLASLPAWESASVSSLTIVGTCAYRGRDHKYAIPRSHRLLPLPRCIARNARRLGTLHIRHVSCMEVGASVSPSAVPCALELPARARLSPPGSATEASWAA